MEVRRAAILALGNLGKGNSKVEEALKRFTQDTDPVTRLDAVVAMAEVGKMDSSVIPTLMIALGSEKETTVRAATKVLRSLSEVKPQDDLPALLDILNKKQQPAAVNSIRVLRGMKSQAVEALPRIAALYPNVNTQDKREILDALTAIDAQGDTAIPVLVEALKEPSAADRREALLGLMRFRTKSNLFMDSLIEELQDTDLENRLFVINIIRGLGPQAEKAIPAMKVRAEDKEPQVRSAAVNALAGFGPLPGVIETIGKLVKDPDIRVRMTTIGVLRRLGQAKPELVIPILQGALESEKQEAAKRSIMGALDTLNKVSSGPATPQSVRQQNHN